MIFAVSLLYRISLHRRGDVCLKKGVGPVIDMLEKFVIISCEKAWRKWNMRIILSEKGCRLSVQMIYTTHPPLFKTIPAEFPVLSLLLMPSAFCTDHHGSIVAKLAMDWLSIRTLCRTEVYYSCFSMVTFQCWSAKGITQIFCWSVAFYKH